MKKVIFIGGTSYSGSTMLDMILANDQKGYSLGEIDALFRPYRRHHFKEIKRIFNDERWKNILINGEDDLYKNLFKYFPEIDFFVDSSKNPFWIKRHSTILDTLNVHVKNILIHKAPIELSCSYNKRGIYKKWGKNYINYHRLYFTLIENFTTISYADLVNNGIALEKLCQFAGIPYFIEKEKFWRKEHHTFFGNNRARIHTSNLAITGDEKLAKLKSNNEYRKIYYEEVKNQKIITDVKTVVANNETFSNISVVLSNKNVLKDKKDSFSIPSTLHFKVANIFLRMAKENILRLKAKLIHSR